jgi:hypothetical protein
MNELHMLVATDFVCPTCKAGVNEGCVTVTGNKAKAPHSSRLLIVETNQAEFLALQVTSTEAVPLVHDARYEACCTDVEACTGETLSVQVLDTTEVSCPECKAPEGVACIPVAMVPAITQPESSRSHDRGSA